MHSRQPKNPSQKTSAVSKAPTQGMFEMRSFIVQPKKAQSSQPPDLKTSLMQAQQCGHNLSHFMQPQVESANAQMPEVIQAKLTIGQPGDKYEQEADAIARQVVQKIHQPQSQIQPESLVQPQTDTNIIQSDKIPQSQLQNQPLVQRRSSSGGMTATPDFEASIQQARGGGKSLPSDTQKSMGKAFGADFSKVKVHTNAKSHQLNQSIQAKAFTTGQNVFFRQGAYNPGSRGGQELLAHELTHVVQQNGSAVQAKSDVVQRTPDMVIQRMGSQIGGNREVRGSTKFPFFKIRSSKPASTTTAPTIDSQPNAFATRSDGSYVVLNVTRFPTFNLIMYDSSNKTVNSCQVDALEFSEFKCANISMITSTNDGDGLGALAVYYIASNTKLANVGATTVISSAEGFYERMGMVPSDGSLDEWVGDTATVRTKALASLEKKWTLT